jgi:predicted nuclease with TOPRIM domain
MSSYKEMIDQLESENENLREQNDELSMQLCQAQDRISELEQELECLKTSMQTSPVVPQK